MKKLFLPLAVTLAAASGANAQQIHLDRLAPEQLEVAPPASRVTGAPGRMQVVERECRMLPEADRRRRIVDIAVQEWGFFGFTVLDQTYIQDSQQRRSRRRLPRSWLDIAESARVADSIAGYWAVTDDGAWILDRQNDLWKGPYGVGVRWRDPWSAAFISWVMCEGGLGEEDLFRRHIAHYVYIDQAIEARYDESPDAAYVAYDVGERPIEPGDLLCSARRSAYRTIAERLRNIGRGVRSHCDIAVKVDAPSDRVLVIGGNVRGSVRLKVFAAEFGEYRDGAPSVRSVGGAGRTIFAHLKLRADPIEADALDSSPTVKALAERGDDLDWFRRRLEGDRPAQVGPPLASSADTISGPIPVL
ncbi:DUF2272 domain-containing protein [Candidatus Rariloculus sp.]|uniref:DUF2272 domain-containing protein n=1 Tax=Candidatus Rariloculus sp. TaxID=3101265 RepID=UPI003D0B2DFD